MRQRRRRLVSSLALTVLLSLLHLDEVERLSVPHPELPGLAEEMAAIGASYGNCSRSADETEGDGEGAIVIALVSCGGGKTRHSSESSCLVVLRAMPCLLDTFCRMDEVGTFLKSVVVASSSSHLHFLVFTDNLAEEVTQLVAKMDSTTSNGEGRQRRLPRVTVEIREPKYPFLEVWMLQHMLNLTIIGIA